MNTPLPRDTVRAWSETVVIPTYEVGPPNRNPMFLEKRVYQGSSGVVYPHPVIESVSSESIEREWTAVFLENAYVKLMILPELGGRLQMALDKTNGYHFMYYNQVIKPALVGLTGPWISGGMEFNWPQHHRPSTYEPLNWSIEKNDDGSRTVWCAETERMFRTRGRHGFRVHPGRSGFDVVVRLANRSAEQQTFLWWANPAVAVNDDYQSVFPPDVHAVMDHGKRDVSDFPIATGVYYKQNYAPGTDISRYKNIPVPTSYMAYHSDYNFVGCYDHGPQAGMLHVANHHTVPGKKQWTWGNGEFGQAWDRQLTDADGPYIELMCGAYTDNQPDFTWLMPGEQKSFVQTFMPYKEIGPASNASRDAVLHMTVTDNRTVSLGIYAAVTIAGKVEIWQNPVAPAALHNHKNMHLTSLHRLLAPEATRLFEQEIDLAPATVWQKKILLDKNIPAPELTVRLVSRDSQQAILDFSPPSPDKPEIPSPAVPAKPPAEIASVEELYLNGLHLEQYRHATYAPEPYYEEALRRDPGDSRCHTALGRLHLHRGNFQKAETHLRAALDRLTLRNPNPFDGEAYYHLGRCLLFQNRPEEAFDVFYKAAWSEAWKSAACFELARLAAVKGQLEEALRLVEESLARNTRFEKASHLRMMLLRHLGDADAAASAVRAVLKQDPLEPGARYEAKLLGLNDLPQAATPNQDYEDLELGLDYLWAGFSEEADRLFLQSAKTEFMAPYFSAWSLYVRRESGVARERWRSAAGQDMDFAFPNLLECVPALEAALTVNPDDALAAYALGNFLYGNRRHEAAIDRWEQCTRSRPDFPTAWRNLGLAYMNVRGDAEASGKALQRAFEADTGDARILYELDQFDKETGGSPARRLARLEKYQDRVRSRDDLSIEFVRLLNLLGRPGEALKILQQRTFHPWEGGEGKAPAQYQRSLFLLAESARRRGDLAEALALLEQAGSFPLNLGEGKLGDNTDNERHYRRGRVLAALGRGDEARAAFEAATRGISVPAGAMYYNDQPPEDIYFQGLAWRELGCEDKAQKLFQRLVDYGTTHPQDEIAMDYFAVSLPDFLVFDIDLNERNRRHCLFMQVLGLQGLGQVDKAEERLQTLARMVPDHAGNASVA